MVFSREVVFMKWGPSQFCFYAKVEGYQGGIQEKPATYSRSMYDGSLQRVYAPLMPRRFMAVFIVDDTRPGTTQNDGTDDVAVGCIDDLKAAWAATDLQVLSFEDAAYWNAEWEGPSLPQVVYDPMRRKADMQASLVQRS